MGTAKKTVLFLSVSALVFVLASCARPVPEPRTLHIFENAGTGEEVVLENGYLQLRFLPTTAEIILTDLATGVEWRSNPYGRDEYVEGADFLARQLVNSQFSMRYADVSGRDRTLFSSQDSVYHGAFSYAVEDGSLVVRYTVGNIPSVFRIPPAMEADRMEALMERVPAQYRGRIRAAYRLYDLDNLLPADDEEYLLSRFPELRYMNIWVLQDRPDFLLRQIEGFLAYAGYTYEEWRDDQARFPGLIPPELPLFNITLRYTLDGRSLRVDVPFDEIAFRPAYPIVELSLLPFMGAGGLDDEGFLFVPDGSGAIINFNNGRQSQMVYTSRVFGWNEAMPRSELVLDNRSPFPVFGVQRNGAALVGIIEHGASYASIRADVSGRNNGQYNFVFPFFDMIHGAVMDISGRSDRLVFLYERELPLGESITVHFIPAERDGHVGMAMEYRNWLLRTYPVLRERAAAGSRQTGVPVAVEIIGAVNKTQHRLGIPFDLPLRLTSYDEAGGMLRRFSNLGWRNVHVKLSGWFNHSVEHSVPTRIRLINELGGARGFRNLVSAADELGFELYPGVDFFFMRNSRAFDGFSTFRDVARHPNRERVQQYPFSSVWFGERTDWGTRAYLATPDFSMELIGGFVDRAYDSFGLRNVAFLSMGSRLGGDFHERRLVSREAAMRMRQDKLADLRDAGIGIMMRTGFAYVAPWSDIIVDMPLEDQGIGIVNTSVPFFQIALRGLVPYVGRAINLAEDYTLNLLRVVESGAGLHFSFMMEPSAVLQETRYRHFFANEYRRWIDRANELYHEFTADFGHLVNQLIVDHVILAPGVTVTVYEDETRVYVNRTENVWSDGYVTVNPARWLVVR